MLSHTGFMSDLLHDHLTLGLRPGCPACAQTEEDLRASLPAGFEVYTLVS
jgi:hydrogenase maturation factor